MTTTVADLSIFCQSILGAENCPALLTPESVALMTSTQVNRPSIIFQFLSLPLMFVLSLAWQVIDFHER